MDEFKGTMRYGQLLVALDKYSRSQLHCRYANTYCVWTRCLIASIYPPEDLYATMVDKKSQEIDSLKQLLRRLESVVYHWIDDIGNYRTFSLPASEYKDYEDLKQRALGDMDGFIEVEDIEDTPFEKE